MISIDTPYVKFKDIEGLRAELVYLKQIGMQAKFAIHPVSASMILIFFRLKLMSLMKLLDRQLSRLLTINVW